MTSMWFSGVRNALETPLGAWEVGMCPSLGKESACPVLVSEEGSVPQGTRSLTAQGGHGGRD